MAAYLQPPKDLVNRGVLKAHSSLEVLFAQKPDIQEPEILLKTVYGSALGVLRQFFPEQGKHKTSSSPRSVPGTSTGPTWGSSHPERNSHSPTAARGAMPMISAPVKAILVPFPSDMGRWRECRGGIWTVTCRAWQPFLLVITLLLASPMCVAAEEPEQSAANLAHEAAIAIEQVHTERSLAILVITKKQASDAAEYRTLWKKTDRHLSPVVEAIKALDEGDQQKPAGMVLEGLSVFRELVEVKAITLEQTVRPYQDLIDLLWRVFDQVVAATKDQDIATALASRGHLLRTKEKILLTRDLVQSTIEEGKLHGLLAQRLPQIAGDVDRHLSEFFEVATDEQAAALRDELALTRARKMRTDTVAQLAAREFDLDLPDWWRVQSTCIDVIEKVEQEIVADLKRATSSEDGQEASSFGLREILIVVLLVVLLNGAVYLVVFMKRRARQQEGEAVPEAKAVAEIPAERPVPPPAEKEEPPLPTPEPREEHVAAPVPPAPTVPEIPAPPPAEKEEPPPPAPEPLEGHVAAPLPPAPTAAPGTKQPAAGGRSTVSLARYFGPTLDALRVLGGSGTAEDIVAQIALDIDTSDEAQAELMGPGTAQVTKQVTRANAYLQREGLLQLLTDGAWSLTDKGKETRLSSREAKKIFVKLVRVSGEGVAKPGSKRP